MLNGALTEKLKEINTQKLTKINKDFDGDTIADFVTNLTNYIRNGQNETILSLYGSWSGHLHYSCDATKFSDDMNVLLYMGQDAYLVYYLYGINIYIKKFTLTSN